jgi:hypothetical protein
VHQFLSSPVAWWLSYHCLDIQEHRKERLPKQDIFAVRQEATGATPSSCITYHRLAGLLNAGFPIGFIFIQQQPGSTYQ